MTHFTPKNGANEEEDVVLGVYTPDNPPLEEFSPIEAKDSSGARWVTASRSSNPEERPPGAPSAFDTSNTPVSSRPPISPPEYLGPLCLRTGDYELPTSRPRNHIAFETKRTSEGALGGRLADYVVSPFCHFIIDEEGELYQVVELPALRAGNFRGPVEE